MSTAAPTKPNQSGYDVSRPGGKCAVSGNPILPGEKFFAALRELPEAFERVDVSPGAWEQFDRAGVIAFWRTVMPHAEQKKKLFVDDQVLCELFERLAETTESAKLNFRFVLGLILMRKRMLVYENTRHEAEKEIWSMRFRGKEDRLDLVNPKLTEEQIGEVSQQMSQILNDEV